MPCPVVLYLLEIKLVPWSVVLTQWNAILAIRSNLCLLLYFFKLHYWNEHVDFIVKKATKRLYSLKVLRKAGVQQPDLVRIYCSLFQSVLEYGAPVWSALPGDLSNVIESVQRRELRIICPLVEYEAALISILVLSLLMPAVQTCQLSFSVRLRRPHP